MLCKNIRNCDRPIMRKKKSLLYPLFTVVFDECKHYEQLSDRQRAAGVHRGNTLKCDQKDLATPKWYRFTGSAGTRMPSTCVLKHYCGTHAPGWLSTAHPTRTGQVVNGKVCFHWGNKCCNWHANIQIKRCNGFYVYKLVRTPVCWLRYCGNAGFGEFKIICLIVSRIYSVEAAVSDAPDFEVKKIFFVSSRIKKDFCMLVALLC